VEARGTDCAGQPPDGTTYAITPAGREEFYNWLRTLVAHPPHEEYPHFIIALSFISLLHPNEAVTLLRERIAALTATADTTRNAPQSAAAEGQLWVFLVE
jgi:DNA-binding PadR family transcriptional regulator